MNAAFAALRVRGANGWLAEELASDACAEAIKKGKIEETALVRAIALKSWIDHLRRDRAAQRFLRLQHQARRSNGRDDADRDLMVSIIKDVLHDLRADDDVAFVVDCIKRRTTASDTAQHFGICPSTARRRFSRGLLKLRARFESVCSFARVEHSASDKELRMKRIQEQFSDVSRQAAIVQHQHPDRLAVFARSAWYDETTADVLRLLLTLTPSSGTTARGRQAIAKAVLTLVTKHGEAKVYRAFDNLKHFFGIAATTT